MHLGYITLTTRNSSGARLSARKRPIAVIVSIYTAEIKSEIGSILFAINRVFRGAPMPRRSGDFLAAAPRSAILLGGILLARLALVKGTGYAPRS